MIKFKYTNDYVLFVFVKIHTKRVMFGKWKNNAKGDKAKKTDEE